MKRSICLIEKFALHDGPGIRTVVFFKGCPLQCIWCSNPETQKLSNQIFYNIKKCIGCEKCNEICKEKAIRIENKKVIIDYEKCNLCGACINICPTNALSFVSEEMSVDDVFEEIIKDVPFYKTSGGGVTVSGGEFLLHVDFIEELFKKCKDEYINTAIETSGFGEFQTLRRLAKVTDYIMYDIKHTDDETHKELTNVSNKLILENVKKLPKIHKNIIIRIPLIRGINDSDKNLSNIINIALESGIREIHILPYHTLGLEKYKQLHKEYQMKETKKFSVEELQIIKDKIEFYKIKCVIGG